MDYQQAAAAAAVARTAAEKRSARRRVGPSLTLAKEDWRHIYDTIVMVTDRARKRMNANSDTNKQLKGETKTDHAKRTTPGCPHCLHAAKALEGSRRRIADLEKQVDRLETALVEATV